MVIWLLESRSRHISDETFIILEHMALAHLHFYPVDQNTDVSQWNCMFGLDRCKYLVPRENRNKSKMLCTRLVRGQLDLVEITVVDLKLELRLKRIFRQ